MIARPRFIAKISKALERSLELDLLLFQGSRRIGIDFKLADAPKATKSMHQAITDLRLDQLWIVYPGAHRYPLSERISVVPLAEISG